jgi:carbon monoxide dehydrogenase subunit G
MLRKEALLMLLRGENRCAASIDTVCSALLDPVQLATALPGCKTLTQTEPDTYIGQVALGVGPVVGTYDVTVRIVDQNPPSHLRLEAWGSGRTGQVVFTMQLNLRESEGATLVAWEVDAEISGLVASVGSRVIGGVARFSANQFFKTLFAS